MKTASKISRPLSIALICDMVPGQAGGSYISTMRFATLLKERGHNVFIIAARDSQKPPVDFYEGVKIYQFFSLPAPGSNRYYFYSFPTPGKIRKIFLKEKPDVVHTMFPSYSCYIAAKIAKKMGIPLVAHSHTQPENIAIFLPKFLQKPWVNKIISSFLVWFLLPAKVVITPSELGKNILLEENKNLPITVLSNGINLTKFKKTEAAQNPNQAQKKIFFVGRLTIEKGAPTLIEAMGLIVSKNPSVVLDLLGTGPLRTMLEERCRALGIEKNVNFLGKISDEELIAKYNEADLFVLPSLVELEGMVVLEAMACGKPILIADSPTSASRYFVKNNGLLFEPNNPTNLAEKAIQILTDDSLRQKMSDASYENVRYYDIHKSVEALEQIYFSLL